MAKYSDRKTSLKYRITAMYCQLKRRALERNLPYLSRAEFVEFASTSDVLKVLFEDWITSNFQRKLSPTVDRIVPAEGYVIGNIQFLTLTENVKKGNKEIPKTMPVAQNKKPVRIMKEEQEMIFDSGKKACDFLGVTRSQACIAIKNNRLLKGWSVSYV